MKKKIYALGLSLLIAGVAQAALVFQMDFNDAAGNQSLTDRGTTGVSGSFTGNATYSTNVAPVNGGGYSGSFGGTTGMANFGDIDALDGLTNMTITAWIRMNSAGEGGAGRIVDDRDVGGFRLYYHDDNDELEFLANDPPEVNGGGSISGQQWTWIAVTYDGADATFYTGDGTTLSAGDTATIEKGPLLANAASLLIGNNVGGTRAFDGLIDNVRIYNSVEDAASLTSIMMSDDVYDALVAPGAWTIAILPDPGRYSKAYPGVFSAQTIWLRDNIKKYNIQCALQLGDLTDNNVPEQWENARESLAVLDGYLDYFFCLGNHDLGPGGNASTRDTELNTYFDYDDYSTRKNFGGAMATGKLDNSYHTFKAGGYDWIVLCLTWGAPDSVVAWANNVLAAHPDHKAILVTHVYMYNDDTRYDWATKGASQSWSPHKYSTPGDMNDGQELWDELIKSNNFVLTVNGHVLGDGTGFRTDANLAGQNVHQMLCNYQDPIVSDLGGGGWLRLLTVNPDGTVQVKSYSPIYNEWNTAADQQFDFDIEWYSPADANFNGVADYYDSELDSDGDGLDNYKEFTVLGTGPFETDSDGDGISDGLETRIGTNPAVSDKETVQAILNHSDEFGYYNEQELTDLNIGNLLIFPDGTNFMLNLQLETTDDLENTPFTASGAPILWSIPASTSNIFMRVRAEP